jgi:membrane protein implicated in regulation of membrane protease activity
MWLIAGLLVAGFLLAALAGFHLGPHVHVVAGVLGLLAAIWLIIMAAQGRSLGLVAVLLSAVILFTLGIGVLAWQGLSSRPAPSTEREVPIEGEHGLAVGTLAPTGIVRVNGEDWTAVSLNGTLRPGERVQVINARGVHLEVWGEDHEGPGGPLDRGATSEGSDA